MRDGVISTSDLLDLLQAATKRDVVKEFLRSKGLVFTTANWEKLREKLQTYLSDGLITAAELVELLTLAEECGDQHIFLYFCSKAEAAAMLAPAHVNGVLRRKDLLHLVTAPELQRLPLNPTIVDVRFDPNNTSLTIKEVESHTRRKLVKNTVHKEFFYKIYTNETVRAVNVAKLHTSGLLEIRVQSRDNTTKYDNDVLRFFRQVGEFFPFSKFKEMSLTRAKDTMWAKRATLGHLLRYTNASICDEDGNTLSATTGSNNNDLSNSKAGASVDHLLSADRNAYCAESNLWFVKSSYLTTNIHVIMQGETNEFALTAKCSAEDYEYILTQIRHFNR